jgi:hypothetical protein
MKTRGRPLAIVLALGLATAACTSPEATRQRAGGPGADPGNRRGVVQMHEGSDPYWKTPRRLPGRQPAPTATARQADRPGRGPADPAASPGEQTK